jgi:hypothetical protein
MWSSGTEWPATEYGGVQLGTTFTASTSSGDAPVIDIGVYDALFKGTEATRVKGGQFTKDRVNGDPKLKWNFLILDGEGNAYPYLTMGEDGELQEMANEDGNVRDLIIDKLTGTGFNIAATTVPGELKVLKALLTADEYKKFEAGEGTDEEKLLDRKVQVEVFINGNGWPGIGNVIAKQSSKTPARRPAPARQAVEE